MRKVLILIIIAIFTSFSSISYAQKESVKTLKLTKTISNNGETKTFERLIRPYERITIIANDSSKHKAKTLNIFKDSLVIVKDDTISFSNIARIRAWPKLRFIDVVSDISFIGTGMFLFGSGIAVLDFSKTHIHYNKQYIRKTNITGLVASSIGLTSISYGLSRTFRGKSFDTKTTWEISTDYINSNPFNYFDKGRNIAGIQFSIGSGEFYIPDLRFRYGKFWINKLNAGLETGYLTNGSYKKATYFMPFVRYYFLNRNLAPFAETNYSLGFSEYIFNENGTDIEYNGVSNSVFVGVGIAYTGFWERFGLELYFGPNFQWIKYIDTPYKGTYTSSVSESVLRLRLNYHF